MPMIQELSPRYNFGSALGQALGAGIQGGMSQTLTGLEQNRQQERQHQQYQKQIDKALSGLKPGASLEETLRAFSKIPIEYLTHFSPVLSSYTKGEQEKKTQAEKMNYLAQIYGQGAQQQEQPTIQKNIPATGQPTQPTQLVPEFQIAQLRALGENKLADDLQKKNDDILKKQTEDQAKINYVKALGAEDQLGGVDPTTLTFQQLENLVKPKKGTLPPYIKDAQKKLGNFIEETHKKGQAAEEALNYQIPEAEKAIENLKGQWGITKYFKGVIPKGAQDVVLNADEQTLNTVQKKFIDDTSKYKGIRLTDEKLRWLSGMTVSPFKSYDANKRALEMQKDVYSLQVAARDAMDEIIAEESDEEGVPPLDLAKRTRELTEKMMSDYIESQPEYQAEQKAKATPAKEGYIRVKRTLPDGSVQTGQVPLDYYEQHKDQYEPIQ